MTNLSTCTLRMLRVQQSTNKVVLLLLKQRIVRAPQQNQSFGTRALLHREKIRLAFRRRQVGCGTEAVVLRQLAAPACNTTGTADIAHRSLMLREDPSWSTAAERSTGFFADTNSRRLAVPDNFGIRLRTPSTVSL